VISFHKFFSRGYRYVLTERHRLKFPK